MTIEQIKTELREMIALGDAATAAPWEEGNGAVWHDCDSEGQNEVCEFVKNNDAAFIARSRTMTPLACKGLLMAIEGLEKTRDGSIGATHHNACDKLESIRQLWEESK